MVHWIDTRRAPPVKHVLFRRGWRPLMFINKQVKTALKHVEPVMSVYTKKRKSSEIIKILEEL
jgi:hypothetical protein